MPIPFSVYGDDSWTPEHNLWAAIIETMVHDWDWVVARKKKPLWLFLKGVTHKRSNDFRRFTEEEYEAWKTEVFIEELTESIFADKEEPGYLYWICQMIFKDDWESRLYKIREYILKL